MSSLKDRGPQDLSPPPNHPTYVQGTPGDDYLRGTEDDDFVYALQGDDIVQGGAGSDLVWGGDGNDVIFGGDGSDTLYGDSGSDILFGDAGDDTLGIGIGDLAFGGTGSDRFLIDTTGIGSIRLGDFTRSDGDVIDFGNRVSADQLSIVDGVLLVQQRDGGVLSIVTESRFGSIEELIASGNLTGILPAVKMPVSSPELCFFGDLPPPVVEGCFIPDLVTRELQPAPLVPWDGGWAF